MEVQEIEQAIITGFRILYPHILTFDIRGYAYFQAPIIEKMSFDNAARLHNISVAIESAAGRAERASQN